MLEDTPAAPHSLSHTTNTSLSTEQAYNEDDFLYSELPEEQDAGETGRASSFTAEAEQEEELQKEEEETPEQKAAREHRLRSLFLSASAKVAAGRVMYVHDG